MTKFLSLPRGRAALMGAVALAVLAGAGWELHSGPSARAETAAQAGPAPAVPVGVQTMAARDVRIWSSFSGRMRAVDQAEIRPEVGGRITQVRIADGQAVKAGDVLFVIDPAPYEAAMARAEANLATARANAVFARTELERATNLVRTQAIPQRLYDERANNGKVTQAAILAAEAELKQARINLDRAYVKAPISGRVGRAEITLGNLVQAGAGAPLLTSIVSNQGIYADFEVDEQTYLKSIHAMAARGGGVPVEVTARGDDAPPHVGVVESFDNRIDTGSGTIRARVRFDNRDGALVPGMFVSVKMATGDAPAALLVQERAIGTDQSKRFVYVVGEDSRVAYREVALGPQVSGQRIVLAGLKPGDRVVVDGLQHIRPDTPVTVRETQAAVSRTLAAN